MATRKCYLCPTFGSGGRSFDGIECVDVEAEVDGSIAVRVDQLQSLTHNLEMGLG